MGATALNFSGGHMCGGSTCAHLLFLSLQNIAGGGGSRECPAWMQPSSTRNHCSLAPRAVPNYGDLPLRFSKARDPTSWLALKKQQNVPFESLA